MALVTIRRSPSVQSPGKIESDDEKSVGSADENGSNRITKSLNECYFANRGAAVVLGGERGCTTERLQSPARTPQPDIQHHLQAMFCLLRPEETLKMAVKLESAHVGRTRYLVVVCRGDEAALLGIDCNESTTVGLVLRVLADTSIKLDGDGGFSVCVCHQQHIFKPVSVQAMWSALQTLHRASGQARQLNHFSGGTSHGWVGYYEERIDSDRSCLNEWHAMDCIESRRPPSPDSLRLKPRQRDETEQIIRSTLKEIMMTVDLDEVTSKVIRVRLEDDLDMDLAEYKSFIDQEMLTILGQMDAPTEIFDHVYLGSEWNASNLEELQRNGVRHILNVTREIDNFFPGMFDYLNVRVYDDDKTDLLKHWDNTFKYINKAKTDGSKVLVHCKMGISRSASVVIAYAMKAYNWNFDKALKHVKTKRGCIKPNNNFLSQLETYQGILDAMKNKEKLQRSKSETNLKAAASAACAKRERSSGSGGSGGGVCRRSASGAGCARGAGAEARPRSWSPDARLAAASAPPPPLTSVSLESLAAEKCHLLMPCAGGSYSVSPNQIIRLKEQGAPSVKHIVNEIENAASAERRDAARRYLRAIALQDKTDASAGADVKPLPPSPPRTVNRHQQTSSFEIDRIHAWDPGEEGSARVERSRESDNIVKCDSGIVDVRIRTSEPIPNIVEHNLECGEKGREGQTSPPSRQSSWSSSDSAVQTDLSRQASWGSSEGRARPLDLISEGETRRETGRSRPRRADNERKFNETCAMLREAGATRERRRGASTWCGRLAASAPAADTWHRAAPRRRRLASASQPDLARVPPPPAPPPSAAPPAPGLVTNLKKEFEARSVTDPSEPEPVSDSPRRFGRPAAPNVEDLSVKVLVGRYDKQPAAAADEAVRAGPSHDTASNKYKVNWEGERRARSSFLRNSFCGAVRGGGGGGGGGAERPPPAPTVVSMPPPHNYPNVLVSTVMSKAQNKKQLQHGKTHPLTRLNMNRSSNRCSNPVYNTM